VLVSSVLLLLIPLTYLAAAFLPASRLVAAPHRTSVAPAAAGLALLLSLAAAAALIATGATAGIVRVGTAPVALGPIALSVRLDAVTVVMLLLVNSIGLVILRFSRRYLDGEPGQPRYLRAFLATLSAVSLLVVTNNLAVLALAWTISSITLHQLLEFYGDRASALVAAHKKFLMARIADVAIIAAFVLLWRAAGTLEIDALLARAADWQATKSTPSSVPLAGLLLAAGVVLRSAQLPFHGWLIQVMEAPTPVSALLHAGIVNIGGFVMIRLAGLMGHLDAAQLLLVVVGTLTATLAGLVMMTRVSIKVALAWSTCAQMGFMLLECGLGAYSLALLHLVAHSLYKAHAFLSSGRTVEAHVRRGTIIAAPRSAGAWLVGGGTALTMLLLLAAATGAAVDPRTASEPTLLVMALIFALAMAPMLARAAVARDRTTLPTIGAALALALVYAAAHWAAGALVAPVAAVTGTLIASAILVSLAFIALFIVQAIVLTAPRGRFARAFYPACFAGFYLDEIFTRLTFRLWPPASVRRAARVATSQDRLLAEVPA
jgi:NAD(P)H-quinone oxidoreductase subunit 5